MIVGHFFLAFVLAALYFNTREEKTNKVLLVGLVAGFFAFLPDIDIVFSFTQLLVLFDSGASEFVNSFWESSRQVHRGLTHSLLVSFISFTLLNLYFKTKSKSLATVTLVILASAGYIFGSALSAAVMSIYAVTGLVISRVSMEKIDAKQFATASFIGLMFHPFGDLFTGTPPEMFYPLTLNLFESRLIFFQDSVINLLAIFALEFSLVAAGLITIAYVKNFSLSNNFRLYSLIGLVYGPIGFFIPAPTLETAYHFVFTVIGVGLFALIVSLYADERYLSEFDYWELLLIGSNFVLAVFLAFLSYLVFYILV